MPVYKTNGAAAADATSVSFGERVRHFRTHKLLTQTELATRMSDIVSYISKVENEKSHFGDYPSEKFIHKFAGELEADEDELLPLTEQVPGSIWKRISKRPELFRKSGSDG